MPGHYYCPSHRNLQPQRASSRQGSSLITQISGFWSLEKEARSALAAMVRGGVNIIATVRGVLPDSDRSFHRQSRLYRKMSVITNPTNSIEATYLLLSRSLPICFRGVSDQKSGPSPRNTPANDKLLVLAGDHVSNLIHNYLRIQQHPRSPVSLSRPG
jgi:hypothetical protein